MSLLKKYDKPSHWYKASGEPCHTMIGANGKERPVTLRDAKKLGLIPSVTEIIKIKSKGFLNEWITEQAILAALTLPRNDNETLELFSERVIQDMEAQCKAAASVGDVIHAKINEFHENGILLETDSTANLIKPYVEWFNKNKAIVKTSEENVVDSVLGYAGRMDAMLEINSQLWIVDFKTQDVKEKPNFYKEWGMQLAAYGNACNRNYRFGLMSIVINRKGNNEVYEKTWEPNSCFNAFKNCLELWKFDREYMQ